MGPATLTSADLLDLDLDLVLGHHIVDRVASDDDDADDDADDDDGTGPR